MAELSADKIVGKTLFAAKQLDKLNASLQKIGVISKGSSAGVVYSYIIRNGVVHWMFYDAFGKPYYVRHSADSFRFSGGISEAVKQQKAEEQKKEIEQKGAIPFYIEKYGKWVLITFIGVTIFREYIKKR